MARRCDTGCRRRATHVWVAHDLAFCEPHHHELDDENQEQCIDLPAIQELATYSRLDGVPVVEEPEAEYGKPVSCPVCGVEGCPRSHKNDSPSNYPPPTPA